jgi:hypothetical protein
MTNEQVVPALLAALMGEGVQPEQIEAAVARVIDAPVGSPLSNLSDPHGRPGHRPTVRAFVFEQARLLERAV